MFVDKAVITIKSGKGGDGSVSFRREPFVPNGGPDGGDGGNGGNVVFRADEGLMTLMDFRYKKKYFADAGQNGMKKKCYGKRGNDLIIKVPVGTIVIDDSSGLVMKDLLTAGDEVIAAKGGKGGRGNTHFKNSVRQAPNFAEAGEEGTERKIRLELKLLADVGIVGFPNVGKSSLLAASTGAKPKIANYQFTTIDPNLGVVEIYDSSFVMADIAGIIEGAHSGVGLGLEFLKHIERTSVLIHVVDLSGIDGRNPIKDFESINRELSSYSENLLKKPMLVCANKIDILGEESQLYKEFKDRLTAKGYKVYPVSAATGYGLKELLGATYNLLMEEIKHEVPMEYEYFDFDAEAKNDDYDDVKVDFDGTKFTLTGKHLRKIYNSTNFEDDTQIRYLYKYIEKSGATSKMREKGLKEGNTVIIYDKEFNWQDES